MADRIEIFIDAIDSATDELREIRKEIAGVGDEAKRSGKKSQSFSSEMANMKTAALGLTAAVVGVGVATKKAFDFGREGAEIGYVESQFANLGAEIGTTSDVLLNDLRTSTRGLISDFELVSSATDLMKLGLVDNRDEAVRLSTVVGGLGMDMDQLVLTLTNQTKMRFDSLGVSVDGFDEKIAALEATGMSASDAFKEAFLQQAEEQLARLGDRADDTVATFDRLDVAGENLANTLKKELTPAAVAAAKGLTGILNEFTQSAMAQDLLEQALSDGTITQREYVRVLGGMQRGLINVKNILRDYGDTQKQVVDKTREVITNTEMAAFAINNERIAYQNSVAAIQEKALAETEESEVMETLKAARDANLLTEYEYNLAVMQTKEGVNALSEAELNALESQIQYNNSVREAQQAASDARVANLDLMESYRTMTNAEMARQQFDAIKESLEADGVVTLQETQFLRDLGLELGTATQSSLAFGDSFATANQAISEGVVPREQAKEFSDAYNASVQQGTVNLDELMLAHGAAPEAIEAFRAKTGEATTAVTEQAGAIKTMADEDIPNAVSQYQQLVTDGLEPSGRAISELTDDKLPSLRDGLADSAGEAANLKDWMVQLKSSIENIPSSKRVDITIVEHRVSDGGGSGGDSFNNDADQVIGGANGLDMMVPPGYPNDSFPVFAQSGERVIVLTPEQQRKSSVSGGIDLQNRGRSERGGGMQRAAAPNINFVYQPMISLADRAEAERVLVPAVTRIVREYNQGAYGA